MAEDKPVTTDPVKPTEGASADVNAELFKKVSGVLGREFKDSDDLLKSVDNLHRMVGDQSIAELRAKAAEADNFSKVISVYAKSEGLSLEDARKELLNSVNDMNEPTNAPAQVEQKATIPEELVKRLERAEAVADKLQERELMELHPESKHVLDSVKALAKAAGKELKEFYESSPLKDVAMKAAAVDKQEAEKTGNTPPSSSRQGPDLATHAELAKKVAAGSANENDKIDLVKKALGL